MKVVMVVSSFPKLSETFIVNKFLGLLERGLDVHIVCQHSERQEWARFPQLQARPDLRRRVHVVWLQRPRWLAALLSPAALFRCTFKNPQGTCRYIKHSVWRFGVDTLRRIYLDAELISLKPNIIHFEFGPMALGRLHLKEILHCKTVVSFRGYDLNYAGIETPHHYEEVWKNADALHFLGEDLWRRAQRRGCPESKTHALIPPAIDADFFNAGERMHTDTAGNSDRPLRIISVGRLEWKKGYEYALQAMRRLKDQDVHFEYRILGKGEHLEAIAFARHQLGLEDSVQLLGPCLRDEIKKQMLWADVFLHTAVSEGFCNAVIEAQAMALPVVTSDADGLSENVADGETGFVVPRRNSEALAYKLTRLARSPELRQHMGQAGRKRVQTHFQLKDQINAFQHLYQSLFK